MVQDKNKNKIDETKIKDKLRNLRLKRLETQLKSNILKRKKVKKNNG